MFVRILGEVRERHLFFLVGYVLMPERAPVSEGACQSYAVQSDAGIEAKSLASAAQEKKAELPRAAAASVSGREERAEAILAKALL